MDYFLGNKDEQFSKEIRFLSGFYRLQLPLPLADYFSTYGGLKFTKELPENIKQNIINSYNAIYLNE